MSSPEEAPSPIARNPNDPALVGELSTELVTFAVQMLDEQGAFVAFGGGITNDGQIVHLGNGDDNDDPQVDIKRLANELAKPKWAVGMILVDTRVTPPGERDKTDAIWMISESRAGFVSHDFLPYSITDGKVAYGKRFRLPDPKRLIYAGRR